MEISGMHIRRYNIFISSTFRDMDFERDLIKYKVIPMLNDHFRDRFVEIQAVDLRMGVNTEKMSEEESARKVLNVCAGSIDESRPFFIGLIGARYGWVPPLERWKEFISHLAEEDQSLMQDTFGKSVTELEIVYGALTPKSLQESHTLFFMRDEASYQGIPEDILSEFCDVDLEQQMKLKSLKERIVRDMAGFGGDDDKVIGYHIDWNPEYEGFDEESERFSETVLNHLKKQIEIELEVQGKMLWWEEEKMIAENNLQKHLKDICTALPGYDGMMEQTLMIGEPGDGRTTLLAWQWDRRRRETDDICLAVCVGKTPYSSAMYYTLARWCEELAHAIGEEDPRGDRYMNEGKDFIWLCDEFYYLVNSAQEKGRKVSIFIDDADLFRHTSYADTTLAWMDYRVNAVVTCGIMESNKILAYHGYWDQYYFEKIGGRNLDDLIECNSRRFHLELPSGIRKRLLKKEHNPVTITSIFRILSMLNGVSFSEVRNSGKDFNETVSEYFMPIMEAFVDDPDSDFMFPSEVASFTCSMMGLDEEWYHMMLGYLSKSPCGLRTSDLEALAGGDWDPVEWAQMTYFIQEYVKTDSTGLWRSEFESFGLDKQTPKEDLDEYAETLPDGDWIKDRLQKKPMYEYETLRYELDRKALDQVLENCMGSDFNFIEKRKMKKLIDKYNKILDWKEFNHAESAGMEKNPFEAVSDRSIRLRKKGQFLEEIRMFKEILKDMLAETVEGDRLDGELQLETLTLLFFNMFGAAMELEKDKKSSRNLDIDAIHTLQDDTQFAYHITYRRLCQVNPLNRICATVSPIVDVLDGQLDIYTHSNTIIATIRDIIDTAESLA